MHYKNAHVHELIINGFNKFGACRKNNKFDEMLCTMVLYAPPQKNSGSVIERKNEWVNEIESSNITK